MIQLLSKKAYQYLEALYVAKTATSTLEDKELATVYTVPAVALQFLSAFQRDLSRRAKICFSKELYEATPCKYVHSKSHV
jgi:hypothetical protein